MLRRRGHRRGPSSPPPAELPDDLLCEILLRLPPLPSSLLRASLVSHRWRRIATDAALLRRFRAFHRRNAGPPLLGFFQAHLGCCSFTPLLEAPNRIPAARFSAPRLPPADICAFHGCRHGLALFLNRTREETVVWNPITGEHRSVPIPPGTRIIMDVTLLRPPGPGNHDPGQLCPFELVMLCTSVRQPVARLYSSQSDRWITIGPSTALPPTLDWPVHRPSIMVGNTLCWLTGGDILELDLDTQSLAVINRPREPSVHCMPLSFFNSQILPMENNGLGFTFVSISLNLQLWQWKPNSDSVARWVWEREIRLDKLLSPAPSVARDRMKTLAFAEDANTIFILWDGAAFMIQLESLQVAKIPESAMGFRNYHIPFYPYTSFFAAGNN